MTFSFLLFFAVFALISLSLFRGLSSPTGWERGFYVTSVKYKVLKYNLASKRDYIAIVFESESAGKHSVYISVSMNGGENFFDPVKIADSINSGADYDLSPHIAIAGNGSIMVSWNDFIRDESTYRIFYSVSADMGANWSKIDMVKLNGDMEILPHAYYDERNVLHLFYNGMKGDEFNLYSCELLPQGGFSEPQELFPLDKGVRGAFFPSIVFDKKNVYIALQQKELKEGFLTDNIFFMSSDDYGESYSSPSKLMTGTGSSESASLSVVGKDIYCVYRSNESNNWGIKFVKSSDGGEEWGFPVSVTTTNANCYSPALVPSGQNDLIILWYDNREGTNKVYSKRFSLIDSSLTDALNISENRLPVYSLNAVVGERRAICFWQEGSSIRAKFTDVSVSAPAVYSATHPQNVWSKFETADIFWEKPFDESGIAGYATILNKSEFFNPTVQNIDGNIKSIKIPYLEDGISYFHIRAIDGAGNYSRTIHYKLMVSRTPLPIPQIESPSHPQGKASPETSALFRWINDNPERIKGYLYSFSKDKIFVPDKFTAENSIKFPDLEKGRYFFNLQAIDKNNQPGRTATYDIVVGSAPPIDPSVYQKIAEADKAITEVPKIAKVERKRKEPLPQIELLLPFKNRDQYSSDTLTARIIWRNIGKNKPEGFSLYFGDKDTPSLNEVSRYDSEITFENLTDGDKYFKVKGRYSRVEKGIRRYYWTSEKSANVKIALKGPSVFSGQFRERLYLGIRGNAFAVSVFFFVMVIALITLKYAGRIAFSFRLLFHRFGVRYRLLLFMFRG